MATFLDRKALKQILETAEAIRKVAGRAEEDAGAVYLVRGPKKSKTLLPLKALHSAAVAAFGGRIGRETQDELVAVFPAPAAALRAALHALHACDLAREFLDVADGRVAIVHGAVTALDGPYCDAHGPAVDRAAKIIGRAELGAAVLEDALYARVRPSIDGHADIEVAQPKRGRIPGLGVVTTVAIKPLGLKPDREREWHDVDAELRAKR